MAELIIKTECHCEAAFQARPKQSQIEILKPVPSRRDCFAPLCGARNDRRRISFGFPPGLSTHRVGDLAMTMREIL